MGDRANVIVHQGGGLPPVVLYTHWGGHDLPETLREALAKRWRWDDHAYLTRIIFGVMTNGEVAETGYGISTGLPDNSYPLLVVDPGTGQVRVTEAPPGGGGAGLLEGRTIAEYTFEEYIALPDVGWETFQENWDEDGEGRS